MPQQVKEQVQEKLRALSIGPADITVEGGAVIAVVEVDPAKGAALEPMRQKAESDIAGIKGVTSARVILTAEKKAPQIPVRGNPPAMSTHKISDRPVAPGVRRIIAVASGKGGVGKSTVAAGLARAFAAMGKKTGLLDADIYGASQPLMMGLRQKPETDDKGMIVPLEKDGLKVISMGFFVDPQRPVIWRGPMVHSAIQQLFRDVAWGDLDVLIVDLPPGTGDAQLSLAQHVPLSGAVIVSTPQEVALNEALKGLAMFEKTNVPVMGMIENMSVYQCPACGHEDHIFGHGAVKDAAAKAKVEFLGAVPLLPAIRAAADRGEGAADDIFKNIAARIYMMLPDKNSIKASG